MTKKTIFVFGSNLAGRHGAGAALFAKNNHGAVYGVGEGLTGSAYALPTKDFNIDTLPLETVKKHVDKFLEFARLHPELQFRLTPIGCGLAGYKPAQIAPMFILAPVNVLLPNEFMEVQWNYMHSELIKMLKDQVNKLPIVLDKS